VYATREGAFLTGRVEVTLSNDYNPSVSIKLSRVDSAIVRGQIVDGKNHAIAGARVFVVGYESEMFITKDGGNFTLPAHAAVDEQVKLYAEKSGYRPTTQWHPAGDHPAVVVLER